MHYLSECLLIKDENQYLIEHLRKNIEAGIEHFYIYDNESKIPVSEFLQQTAPELLDSCTIEPYVIQKDGTWNFQLDCYRRFIREHGHDTKWCSFTDTDEIYTGDLKTVCKQAEKEGYKSLEISQVIHGANRQAFASEKTMFERFGSDVVPNYHMVKCVSQIEFVGIQKPHNTIFWYATMFDKKVISNKDPQVQLHHFIFRSLEEYIQKQLKGGWEKQRKNELKRFYDFNVVPNDEKQKVLEKYKQYNLVEI